MPSLDLIATTTFGLEAVARRELEQLGYQAKGIQSGWLLFQGDETALVRANLHLRTADRVLIRVGSFPATDFGQLFDGTRDLPWERWLGPGVAFPVSGRSIKSQLSSVPACQKIVKKAIVERLRAAWMTDTLPETGPSYSIEVALLENQATLVLDTTGPSLHKRGYRTWVGQAPLKETLAAAMVLLSFWKPDRPLIDPFCGSGTIPIEAALIGRNIAPGLNRTFTAQGWPQIEKRIWEEEIEAARAAILPSLPERILGTDIDESALALARKHARAAGVENDIHFQRKEFQKLTSKRPFGCVITNPPYGKRWGDDPEVRRLYESMPDVLRRLPTWSHFILTSHDDFETLVGQPADRRRKLYNGRIRCTYFQFFGPHPSGRPTKMDVETDEETPLPDAAEMVDSFEPEEVPSDVPGEVPVDAADTADAAETTTSVEPSDVETSSSGATAGLPSRAGRSPSSDIETPPPVEPTEQLQEKPKKKAPSPTKPKQAFGGITSKGREQAELFATRLTKRAHHLRRLPTRQDVTCYRLYERDVPEIPLVVDRYEDYLHIGEYERPHDRTPAEHADWLDLMADAAAEALDVPRDHVFLKQRKRQRGKTQHERVADEGRFITVAEGGLKFLVNLSDYVDTGLFLDHRLTRDMVRREAKDRRFLNLFGYTGSFSIYAADGGAAETTTVDLSNTYCDWAMRNFRLNYLAPGPQYRFVRDDVMRYLENHPPGDRFDLVVADPPTYSNSKSTETDWDVQRDHMRFLEAVLKITAPGGVIYFSTNFRTFKPALESLPGVSVREISRQTVPPEYRNRRIHRCWRIIKTAG